MNTKARVSTPVLWTSIALLAFAAVSGFVSRFAATRAEEMLVAAALPPGAVKPDGLRWEYIRVSPVLGRLVLPKATLYVLNYKLPSDYVSAVFTCESDGQLQSARVLGSTLGTPYRERLAQVLGALGRGGNRGISTLDGSIAPLIQDSEALLSEMEMQRTEARE